MIMPMSFDRFENMKQCFKTTSKYSFIFTKGADVKKLEESIQLKGNGGTFHLKV